MSLTKLTDNVNNVQSLADKPALTPAELKAVFDEAGNTIKTYLNTILTAEVDTLITSIQNSLQGDAGDISALQTLTATMKAKLDGIENNANKYVHPTTSGNKHIPSGGSSGKILRWASDGTATWGNDQDTTYSNATQSTPGLMSSADKTKLDGIATGANKYVHPTTSGNKHIPSGGSSGQILRWSSDGTAVWGADNNTTYSDATTSTHGLMSTADKTKLNGIATGANKTTVENVLTSTSTTNALSAAQGKALNTAISGKQKEITVGSSAPSGGSNGDIYIQYFT